MKHFLTLIIYLCTTQFTALASCSFFSNAITHQVGCNYQDCKNYLKRDDSNKKKQTLGCTGALCKYYEIAEGEVLGCTEKECQAYPIKDKQRLYCNSINCQYLRESEAYEQVFCSRGQCGHFLIEENHQIGCTAQACSSYSVPESYTLGCTATECNLYPIQVNNQLGCDSNNCDYYFVPNDYKLFCTRKF